VRNRYLVRAMTPKDLTSMWEVSERMTGIRFDVAAMTREAAAEWLAV
jgi:hypothetical protein